MKKEAISIRCEAIENFTLNEFYKLKNIKRKYGNNDCMLFKGDKFECDESMARYLSGKNEKGKVVVRILEIEKNKK